MLFLPYRLDANKKAIPFFTILICILCSVVYYNQYQKDNAHFEAIDHFCYQTLDKQSLDLLRDIASEDFGNHCYEIFNSVRKSDDPEAELVFLAKNAKPIGLFPTQEDEFNYYHIRLVEMYNRYDRSIPDSLTDKLVYDPNDLDIVRMVTSTFSHGDIYHLLGNILFFYIFSAAIELVMGSIVYLVNIAVATIVTSLAYSYSMAGVENALPTLGLSGVVMFSLATLGVMFPKAQIRCFFWFLIFFKFFRVPALLITVWYVGWDIYNMHAFSEESRINYVAHVSGAVMGVIVGAVYAIFKRDRLSAVSGGL